MRWKLLVITSLAASVAGVGLCVLLVYMLLVSTVPPAATVALAAATLVLPIASITYATIFVYRHTARRRKLQAFLTTLASLLLTVAALLAIATVSNRRINNTTLPQQPGNFRLTGRSAQ